MSDIPSDFDPESRKEREIAGRAADDESDFLSLMGHMYRGEVGRTTSWRARLDRTTNWAVIITATLLTWAFSSESRPHYILLVGMVMVSVFLGIEARRYQTYDIWRSRVRMIEENVFANLLEPEGVEHTNWRELLSDDLRKPKIKTPNFEAISRRLRRIYLPLLTVLLAAWIVKLIVFPTTQNKFIREASLGGIPGILIILIVILFYISIFIIAFWPKSRYAKGEFKKTKKPGKWK